MALFLDAPIEDLKLSKRVRNALHLGGLHTLRSVLECDYKTAIRGFGPTARAELTSALEASGFAPLPQLYPPELDDTSEEVSKLSGQMEESFQRWGARLEYFEMRLRALTARAGRQCCPSDSEFDEQAHALATYAHEFRARLTTMRTASAALRKVASLPPEQSELLTLLEEQSVRVSLLVYRLFDMLSPGKPNLLQKNRGGRTPLDESSYVPPELAVGCESLLQATDL